MIVAFDNGIDGGICAISSVDGSLIAYTAMPVLERKDKREIDAVAVREWLRDLNIQNTDDIVIEEPLKHAKSSQAMRSMGISFGTLATISRLMGLEPYCVEVREWQRPMLGTKVPAGHTKSHALKRARQLEPDEDWLKNDRCRTPHDGIVDAFLIAYYFWAFYSNNEHNRPTHHTATDPD